MPTLSEIFDKRKILLYQNESLDLDHYYQEPYQDEHDEIKDMGKPFETDEPILALAISWTVLAAHIKSVIWFWRGRKYSRL